MVSEVSDNLEQFITRTFQFILDLLDLMFAELFLWVFTIITRIVVWILMNTLKLRLQRFLSQLPSELQILQW